jgi:hypothetical protein
MGILCLHGPRNPYRFHFPSNNSLGSTDDASNRTRIREHQPLTSNRCFDESSNVSTATQVLVSTVCNTVLHHLGIPFPMLNQSVEMEMPKFNATSLARVLGYLGGRESTRALISFNIEANLTHPTGECHLQFSLANCGCLAFLVLCFLFIFF